MKKYYLTISLKNLPQRAKIIAIVFFTIFLSGCSYQSQPNPFTSPKIPTPLNTSEISPIIGLPTLSSVDESLTKQPPLEILTQNGISLSLNWVYADKFRIAIEYRVIGVNTPQGYQLPCPVQLVSMNDNFGNQYDTYKYGYGNTEYLITNCVLAPDQSFVVTHNFYLLYEVGQEEFDLDIEIIIGGMQVVTDNGDQAIIPNYGNFHFDRKLINNGNLTLTSSENVNFNGLTATLNRLEINSQLVNAYICITYDNQKGWYPEAYLLIGEEKIYADPILTFRTDLKNIDLSNWLNQFTIKRCYRLTFFSRSDSFIKNNSAAITIALEKLEINILDAATQDDCNAVKIKVHKNYPNLDFLCQIDDRDGGYGVLVNVTKIPTGMSLADAQKISEQAFINSVDGPWSFSLSLP